MHEESTMLVYGFGFLLTIVNKENNETKLILHYTNCNFQTVNRTRASRLPRTLCRINICGNNYMVNLDI